MQFSLNSRKKVKFQILFLLLEILFCLFLFLSFFAELTIIFVSLLILLGADAELVRRIVISLVLRTDMSKHAEGIRNLQRTSERNTAKPELSFFVSVTLQAFI